MTDKKLDKLIEEYGNFRVDYDYRKFKAPEVKAKQDIIDYVTQEKREALWTVLYQW